MSTQNIVWPDWLPPPLVNGYGYSPTDRRLKTEMEIGGVYRVEFDTDETVANCTLLLDQQQLAFFEAFERHMLRQGTVWFKMPILTAGAIEHHIVRFKERPKMSEFRNGIAIVSMVLDVQERVTYGEAETLLLYEFGPDILIPISRLHEVLHVEAPGVTILPADL